MKLKVGVFIFFFASLVFASAISSHNYNIESTTISDGASNNLSSSNYREGIVVGEISGAMNSLTQAIDLGFFYTIPLGKISTPNQNNSSPGNGGQNDGQSGGGGAGGGGGAEMTLGGASTPESFSVDLTNQNVRIILNETKTRQLVITNSENISIVVTLSSVGDSLEKIISFENSTIVLGPHEQQTLNYKIVAPIDPGIYAGKIILKSSSMTKEILVSLNVQSKETIFDVSLAIPQPLIVKGNPLRSQITLSPVGEKGVDVTIKYLIKDFKGNVYREESNTFYVSKQISFVKDFNTTDLAEGDYVLGAEMTYIGGFAAASAQFEVAKKQNIFQVVRGFITNRYFFTVAVLLILFVILLLWKHARYKKLKKELKNLRHEKN